MARSFMCRVCQSKKNLSHIFKEDDGRIVLKMHVFLDQPIAAFAQLPQYICIKCISKLNDAYQFKIQYQATHQKLKSASKIARTDKNALPNQIVKKNNLSSSYESIKEKESISAYLDDGMNSVADDAFDDEDASASNASYAQFEYWEIEAGRVDYDEEDIEVPGNDSTTLEYVSEIDSECSAIEEGQSSKRRKATYDRNKSSISQTLSNNDEMFGKFQCYRCGKVFSNSRLLKYHLRLHSDPDAFKCEECGKRLSTSRGLKFHANMIHPKEISCFKCGRSFNNEYQLAEHELCHENTDLFKCQECKEQFSTGKLLECHLKLHDDPADAFNRKKSGNKFSENFELKRDKTTHSNNFKCCKCGRSFNKEEDLAEHELSHENTDLFKCQQCKEQFTTRTLLECHLKVHHDPADAFNRKENGNTFPDNFELKRRKKSKDLKCPKCTRSFRYQRSLKKHELSHQKPDEIKCQWCGKQYSSRRHLTHHVKLHRDPGAFMCKECDNSYSSIYALKLHQDANSHEFKCLKCDKTFKYEAEPGVWKAISNPSISEKSRKVS